MLVTYSRLITGCVKVLIVVIITITGCKKDTNPDTPASYVSDIDGNLYRTVLIGSQVWMADNLRVMHFRNGEPIPYIKNVISWYSDNREPLCCDFNDKSDNAERYGKFYNAFTVLDERKLAPEGWHIPSNEEWTILINYLGGQLVAGGKMKDTSMLWLQPNFGATNESGFSAEPGGFRDAWHDTGYFKYAYIWSSTLYDSTDLICLYLSRTTTYALFTKLYPECGLPVRCIKD